MKFTFVDLHGEEKVLFCRTPKIKKLGELFKGHIDDIKAVKINGEFILPWVDHRFNKKDDLVIYANVEDIGTIIGILVTIVSTILSIILKPKPKKPSSFKSQPSQGVAGIQNTIAPGTPKFLTYGIRRVFGHLIGSQTDIINPIGPQSGTHMNFAALYFMGVGPICCISEVKINNTHIGDIYGPPIAQTRLGTEDQTLITGWEFCHQTYSDGRVLEIPVRNGSSKTIPQPTPPITYTTKGGNVNQITLFFQFPAGLFAFGVHGKQYPNYIGLRILRKRNSQPEGYWTDLGLIYSDNLSTQDGFFWKLTLDCPDADQWDFKINVETQSGFGSFGQGPSMNLYNVMETIFIRTTYPLNALLEVHGVGSGQITGFDQMETSALVEGRLVGVPNNGIYTPQCSRNRVWIVRDILLNSNIGLGNRIDSSLWDTAAGQRAADYYEESVTGFDGVTEQRDYCDLILNEVKPGWDWLKILLYEGRASLYPSSGKWKYQLDIDRTPNLMYSYPGNIIEDTLQHQVGNEDKEINTIKGEFPWEEIDYKVVPVILTSPTRGSDPERIEDVSYVSLTRKSQVSREMNFLLKKRLLIKKKWTWKSPKTAVVSEPYNVDWLAYRTSKNLRGYTGLVEGGATTSKLPVGKSIYLTPGLTWTAHVRQGDTVEERFLSNTTGNTYSVINFTSPLSFTPEQGDIWVVGSSIDHKVKIQIDEIETDGETYKIVAHHHIPEVYDDSLLYDITALVDAEIVESPPSPLLKVQVGLTISLGLTITHYQVVPSFNSLAGDYTFIGTNSITLASYEPELDDFFNDTYIIADEEGPLKVLDYIGSTKTAIVEDPGFLTATTSGGEYSARWSGFSPFYGFRIEGSTSSTGPFLTTGLTPLSVEGATEFVGASLFTGTYSYFRFTPFNQKLQDNLNARWVTGIGITDTTAPLPPVYVDISSDDLMVNALFRFAAPVDRDLKTANIRFYQNSPLIGSTASNLFTNDISILRDDTATLRLSNWSEDLTGDQNYGDSIFARVSVTDYFGNQSVSAISILGTTLTSGINGDYASSDIIDNSDIITISGTTNTTICSLTVNGGIIVPPSDAIRLDSLLTITPGITTSKDVTFQYAFGGSTISSIIANISDSINSVPDDSPYWLTCIVEPVSNISQRVKMYGYGRELTSSILRTANDTANVDLSQTNTIALAAQMSTTGATITVHRSILRAISYANDTPDAANISFTPGITANFLGNPTTVQDALDDLGQQTTDLGNSITGLSNSISGLSNSLNASVLALSNSQIYVVSGFILGRPENGLTYLAHPFAENSYIKAGGEQSHGFAVTPPGATATFTLKKNNSSFGTMIFGTGLTTATFTIAATTSFLQTHNDYLTVTSPTPADITLADIGFSLYFKRGIP